MADASRLAAGMATFMTYKTAVTANDLSNDTCNVSSSTLHCAPKKEEIQAPTIILVPTYPARLAVMVLSCN